MRRFLPRALTMAALAVTTAACAAGTGTDTASSASTGGRYQVLVPALVSPDGAASREGTQTANQLRNLMSEMRTHVAMNDRDVRRAMSQYEIENLDAITARQLAQQLSAQLSMWGTIQQGGQGLQADVRFTDVRSGDEIVLDDITGSNPNELAQAIFAGFQRSVEGIARAADCNDYLSSEQFERALETCEAALAVVPRSTSALYGQATALLNLERDAEALAAYRQLLEVDPAHQDGLLGAGLAASRLEDRDAAMGFYRRFMELDPENVQVRMTVAHSIFETGDVISAYQMLQPAAATNADDGDFQRYFFSIAASAGQRVMEQDGTDAARPYLESAMEAYRLGFSGADVEMDASVLRQAIAVNNALGRTDDAIRLAQQATQTFADDPAVWSVYATVLGDAGRHTDAIEALNRVIAIDENYPDAYIRRALQRIEAGQRQQAEADLQRAAATNPENVSRVLLGMGNQAVQNRDFREAERLLALAAPHASGENLNLVNFLRGYAIFQQGDAIARANTQGNVAQAREAVALFERAEPFIRASTHQQRGQILDAIQQYLENQRAIIRAGTR